MPTFTVPSNIEAQLAKDFLRKYAGVSLTLWRKIKHSNSFYINQQPEKPTTAIVHPNDIISYTIEQNCAIKPVDLPLHIVYEDEYLLVADKPAGQLVHPTTKEHEGTLANAILFYYTQNNCTLTYHPVHRLDKNTSGLVLISKMPHIQHLLSLAGHKKFHRTYQALVTGKLFPENGTINAPIARHPGSIIERMVSESGQTAITHYKTLKSTTQYSLLELTLETGRTHQIRVHLASLGHPILGDDLYGGSVDLIQRQALHASNLTFIHPISQETIRLKSTIPTDMQKIMCIFW